MYTANSPKELKKLMKEDKFPIQVTDEETKKIVEILESLKSKGVLPTAKDEIMKTLIVATSPINKVVSEVTTVAIVTVSLATIIALYALYKGKNIKVKFGPNGPILTTEN